jgi:hypothetical protein
MTPIEVNGMKEESSMNGGSTGMSVADVAALSGGGFGGFGNNGLEGLIYLAVIGSMFGWGGNGFGWGNGGAGAVLAGNLATQNDVQRGFDTAALQDQSRDILAAVNNGTAQGVAATNQVYHDILAALTDKYGELARDIAGVNVSIAQVLANQNECSGSTKQLILTESANTNANIAQNKYDVMMALAGMEQRITSKMDQNKIEALQQQVNQLQLQQATAGMLKFPNAWTYGAGPFPPIFGNTCPNQ